MYNTNTTNLSKIQKEKILMINYKNLFKLLWNCKNPQKYYYYVNIS
jgi:hypothetical protein